MQIARLTRARDQLLIQFPYNADLIEEIRGIPGRRWNVEMKVWSVPLGNEQQVREVIRPYYQIEGEPPYIEYETVRVRITGKTSSTRYYCGGVTVDGRDIFSPTHGYLDMRENDVYEILEHRGGFVRGDGYIKHGQGHAFEVEYELVLRVRKDVRWKSTGRADYWGTYEFLSNELPSVDDALWSEVQGILKKQES